MQERLNKQVKTHHMDDSSISNSIPKATKVHAFKQQDSWYNIVSNNPKGTLPLPHAFLWAIPK